MNKHIQNNKLNTMMKNDLIFSFQLFIRKVNFSKENWTIAQMGFFLSNRKLAKKLSCDGRLLPMIYILHAQLSLSFFNLFFFAFFAP